MKKKRAVTLKLSEEDIAFLDAQGGKTRTIQSLIKAANNNEPTKEEGIEDKFWNRIVIPGDHHLMETYHAIVETHISNGYASGSMDYFLPILMGQTGFDQKTLIKHARKLGSAGYIVFQQLNFRPTLRLIEGTKEEDFGDILLEYQDFLRSKKNYTDFLSKKEKEK